MITAEYLKEQIAQMEAVITAHRGAIEFANHLLSVLDGAPTPESLTVDEFAELVGGPGAVAKMQETERP